MQRKSGTGGTYVEKPAKTYTSIRLARHLVRAPHFQSEGREFEAPAWKWTRLSDNIVDLWGSLRYMYYCSFQKRFSWIPLFRIAFWSELCVAANSNVATVLGFYSSILRHRWISVEKVLKIQDSIAWLYFDRKIGLVLINMNTICRCFVLRPLTGHPKARPIDWQ